MESTRIKRLLPSSSGRKNNTTGEMSGCEEAKTVKIHTLSKVPILLLDLPSEILLDILSRLPIKSILRCRYLCKLFNELISSPTFTCMYRNNSKSLNVIVYNSTPALEIIDVDKGTSLFMPKFLPLPAPNDDCEFFSIFGSCDSLVCILKLEGCNVDLYVGNPILHQYIQLPEPVTMRMHRVLAYGLGHCQFTEKYKVLRITTNYGYQKYKNEVEIFTIGLDEKWRTIVDPNVPYNTFRGKKLDKLQHEMVAFNSGLHWIVHPVKLQYLHEPYYWRGSSCLTFSEIEPKWGGMYYICAFDLKEEKVNAIQLPRDAISHAISYGKLGVMFDKLCLCNIYDYDDYSSGMNIYIWLMVEYGVEASWTKQFVVTTSMIPACLDMFKLKLKAVALLNEGVVLISDGLLFVFYDLISNDTLMGFQASQESSRAIPYVPSFVSLSSVVDGD